MKKKALLVSILLTLGLVACGQKEEGKMPTAEKDSKAEIPQKEVLIFTKEKDGKDIIVESSDRFDTATITIGNEKYLSKRVVSGDGIKMETEDKNVSVHFAKGEGVLVKDGKEFMLNEKKNKKKEIL